MNAFGASRRTLWSRGALTLVSLVGAAAWSIGPAPGAANTPRCLGKRSTLIAQPGKVTTGTNRDDVILGTDGRDVIRGLGGNDLICAMGGPDSVLGGAGADRINTGRGADTAAGGGGNDVVIGGEGDDRLVGGGGDDVLRGNGGEDRFSAGPGDDTVTSRDGAIDVAEAPDGGSGINDVATVDDLDTPVGFEDVETPSVTGTFNNRITHLGNLANVTETSEPTATGRTTGPVTEGDYSCTVTEYSAAPGYDEMFLMNPTTDVIYPGSIIYGDTVSDGKYVPLVADRRPIRLSVSLQNITGSPSRTVQYPTLSTVRAQIKDILNSEVTGKTPAQIQYSIEEVHSEDQLKLSLGANYRNPTVKLKASFDFSRADVKGRVIGKFQQIYYTIDMDAPASPAEFFRTLPSVEKLGSASPMYVATVTYGRQILFTAESTYSGSETAAALDASIKAGVQEGGFDAGLRNSRVLNQSTIKALVLGGSGAKGAPAVVDGVAGIKDLIRDPTQGDYSKESPGVPLSYKLRYVKDNSVGRIVLSSTYNVRKCERVKSSYTVALTALHWDTGDGNDVYGWVRFRVGSPPAGDSPEGWTYLFQRERGAGVNVGGNTFWPKAPPLSKKTVTIATPADGSPAPDRFTVQGELREADGTGDPDDMLGLESAEVMRREADTGDAQTQYLNFNRGGDDGGSARVEFSIIPAD